MRMLYQGTGKSQGLTVCDVPELYGEKGSFRVLRFADEAVQGALDLNDPSRIVLEYPRAILHLLEANRPEFEDVFLIGHGIGTIAGRFPDKRFKVAELQEAVLEASRRFFGYRADNVVIGDGREVLSREETDTYDAVIVDAFSEKGTPLHLVSGEFFEIVREKLHPDGLFVLNLFGKSGSDRFLNAVYHTLGEEFAHTKAFALSAEGEGGLQNVLLAARNAPVGFHARRMAGFVPFEPGQGHRISDRRANHANGL